MSIADDGNHLSSPEHFPPIKVKKNDKKSTENSKKKQGVPLGFPSIFSPNFFVGSLCFEDWI